MSIKELSQNEISIIGGGLFAEAAQISNLIGISFLSMSAHNAMMSHMSPVKKVGGIVGCVMATAVLFAKDHVFTKFTVAKVTVLYLGLTIAGFFGAIHGAILEKRRDSRED